MAKITVRKETGTLLFDFNYRGARCREQTTLKDTKTNRRKMEKVLERIEQEIVAGTFDYARFFPGSNRASQFESSAPVSASVVQGTVANNVVVPPSVVAPVVVERTTLTFVEFTAIWLRENGAIWRNNTLRAAKVQVNGYLLPRFGSKQLHQILKADCLAFRADIAAPGGSIKNRTLSAKTVNEIMQVLGAILAEGADRYEFPNPMQNVKRLKAPKVHIDPMSFDEVEKFISAVRPDYKQYFIVRFFTGLRTGEVHGLQWKYIDFERREILVRETYSHLGKEYTKNDGSQREVHMSEPVYQALKAQHTASAHLSEYVFCTRIGTPIDPLNVNKRIWKPTLKLLGMKDRRFYQTRHTAATLWLASGEAPEWIAKQMGHTSTEMLFKVYSRYVPNLTRQDGSAFERLLLQRMGGNIQ
ncbi:Putative defective protein IntQ [Zhongshania aliphaticivorans]|uniref:Defective protein IntQ n=1 Tax=Zhongshania aliphaticivorans TaxID=1470434 RepID=A0A5S9NTN0_9GAMM|nr:site-specific integrase [Zhongshania aliphaticivorans]CAA0094034.1 Putative defective protein IntQ [Zhongshania aliphaticivorans]CAA0112130.1 Putative defective protein IntQ [Zhongshania aliphaticivorans]